jgi:hypothetical protein
VVVHDVLREAKAHRRQHAARVALEHLEHAEAQRLGLLDLLLHLEEDRGVRHAGADVVADRDDHDRQPEPDAPAPREELLLGERAAEHEQHDGRHEVADRHGGLRPRRPEAARTVGAVLGDEQHRAAPLAAHGEALDET